MRWPVMQKSYWGGVLSMNFMRMSCRSYQKLVIELEDKVEEGHRKLIYYRLKK